MFLAKLVAKPPQLVPSVLEVFGTERPNPFDFDYPVASSSQSQSQPQPQPQEQTHARPAPMATTVWAKTADLGVVERSSRPVNAASLSLKENRAPAAPDTAFPDASHAVLIEGFVFPSHKHKLAKKVEKLLVQSSDAPADDDEIVVSDSDESGDSDAASDASSASFALSDFDEDEEITLDALSLFSNLWRLLSAWVTHETALLVAGRPLPAPEVSVVDNAEARAVRYRMAERRNAFAMMVGRPIPQAAQRIGLGADRTVHQKVSDITATFALRDAIDARNSHQVRRVGSRRCVVKCRMSDVECLQG